MKTSQVEELLKNDNRIKLQGCDIDGLSRGKIVNKEKFLKSINNGFGFCSVVFGWDMHDKLYQTKSIISNSENGFGDINAKIDLSSFRRIPWEDDMPCFLVDFYYTPLTSLKEIPLPVCPRNLLKSVLKGVNDNGYIAKCGMEFEWYNFKETPDSLSLKKGISPTPLTPGMFGYSVTRPLLNKEYFYSIYDLLEKFDIPIEGLHTESGPGVYEVALNYTDALKLADRAHLFKTSVKSIAQPFGIIPCFMAKPHENLPGSSGHIHISLADLESGKGNQFSKGMGNGLDSISGVMKNFLAGVLVGLPSIMAVLAPNVNSYKRYVSNFWAPINVTYGFENRTAAVRIISPPSCPPEATRMEMRVSGADVNPYLAIATVIACGNYGVSNKMELPFGPLEGDSENSNGEKLPRNLNDAIRLMKDPHSFARKVLGDVFVEHYCLTREHEWGLWCNAVTDWEMKRYMETA